MPADLLKASRNLSFFTSFYRFLIQVPPSSGTSITALLQPGCAVLCCAVLLTCPRQAMLTAPATPNSLCLVPAANTLCH
jgi:hypothetical protein